MKPDKPVTIKDIAVQLGMHHTTVSRALHDHPRVSPVTKELVLSLAEEWDYHPDTIARSFRTRQSNTIGVMVPDIRNPFFAHVISGIEEEAYDCGYNIIVVQSHEDYSREVLNVRTMISNQVCGALVCISEETGKGNHFKVFTRRKTPLVFFDRACEHLKVCKITWDDFEGAFCATEYLIKLGYKKIAHIAGSQTLQISRNRFNGYLEALKKYDIPFDERLVVYGSLNEESGANGCKKLCNLKTVPDAIFAVNDPVAIGAFFHIKKKGLRIPDDIAIVGFGNIPVSALVDPPLTTINQPTYEMGKQAAQIMMKQINHKQKSKSLCTKIIKTELIVRKSA